MFLDPGYQPDMDFLRSPMTPPIGEPDGGTLVRLCINANWLPYISGACLLLTKPHLWATASDADTEDIIERANSLIGILNNGCVEEPFYQDDAGADSTAEPAQPWYEQISDWIIEIFLATTLTTQAAILYAATIPKARIAIRTGNLGAIYKILLNGVQMLEGNSFAAVQGHVYHDLDLQGFATAHSLGAPPWNLQIQHFGDATHDGNVGGVLTSSKLEVELGDIRPRDAVLQFQQSACGLQVSTDGINWTTIYDPTTCINDLVQNGISNDLNNGTLQRGGGQPGPTQPPAGGQCQTYHVQLSANSQWHLPSPLLYQDTIQVTNVKGGWSDGTLDWWCPDGSDYRLGVCLPGGETHVTGDPLNPGAFHMALIMKVGATWFPAPTAIFTNLAGTNPIDVVFQANDSPLNANTGQISFDVEVCSSATGHWCKQWDFTVDQQGFGFYPNPLTGVNYGTYVAGQGFVTDSSLICWIRTDQLFPADIPLNEWEIDVSVNGVPSTAPVSMYDGPGLQAQLNGGSGTQNRSLQGSYSSSWAQSKYLWLQLAVDGGSLTLHRLRWRGNGTNPFGTSNC